MTRLIRWTTAGAVAVGLLPCLAGTVTAQEDGGDVLRTAMERYEARLGGVDTVTIVQRTQLPMGGEQRVETRLVKELVDGRSLLVPDGSGGGSAVAGIYGSLPELTERAVLRGQSTVDGHDVFVVDVTGLQDLDFGQGALSTGQGGSFEADSATLYLDSERYLLRRADMHGRMETGMGERAVSVRAQFRDFREIDGYVHPYRMRAAVRMEGMGEQMSAMMEKMRQGGADSAQKAMMEEAMSAMMGGEMTVTTTVQEVRVGGGGAPDGD